MVDRTGRPNAIVVEPDVQDVARTPNKRGPPAAAQDPGRSFFEAAATQKPKLPHAPSALQELHDIHSKLDDLKSSLSGPTFERAAWTIRNFSDIANNLSDVSKIESDDLRNREINRLTGNAGAEDGFASGKTAAEAEKNLRSRVDMFLNGYKLAQNNNDLGGFFSAFSAGDPCLSGRVQSLANYIAKHEGIDVGNLVDPTKKLEAPSSAISEFLDAHLDDNPHLDIDTLTPDDMRSILKDGALKSVLSELDKTKNTSGGRAFTEFLKENHMWNDDAENPLLTALTTFIASKHFDAVAAEAKSQTKMIRG